MTMAQLTGPPRYRFADLELDTGRRQVSRGPRVLHLGKLSYETLRVLVEAAPNVVSQDNFAETVWRGRVVGPETVTQRVKLVRNALSDDARRPRYVGLVRGQGYRLLPRVQASGAEGRAKRSLAVLPFENLSGEPEDAYFAAGVHEEILARLAQLPDLRVLARTTVRKYADASRPIPEIAADLGVSAVMEGSIRYTRERVRITAQLIDGVTGAHLWADTYEHDRSNAFAAQAGVASRIARALGEGVEPKQHP